ncbi:MAG: hypothetical protein AB7O28_22825 [Vicinamibacterales bacterium]
MRPATPRRRLGPALVLAGVLALGPAASQAQPAPGATLDAQLTFLATAPIVASRPIGRGTTGALRVTLSDGLTTHDASFQSVAIDPTVDGKKRAGEMRFADHYRYNLAAWRLARLLGLAHMTPATVERSVNGKRGALSWWVDDVQMDEAEREKRDAQPPSAMDFYRQQQRMFLFAELVRDMDRNKGNVLYTADWRVIMLDFTRAFRLDRSLKTPTLLGACDRAVFDALQGLTRAAVERATDSALRSDELGALMARRDLLVAHFQEQIRRRGEASVLY